VSKEVRDQVIQDGPSVGELVLHVEARLWELLSLEPQEPIKMPDGSFNGTLGELSKPKPIIEGSPDGSFRGTIRVLPNGISKKLSHYTQEIHHNGDLMMVALEKAVKRETIPTRYDVLKVSF